MVGWIIKALIGLGLNRPRTTYGQRTVNPASADADCLVIVSKHDARGLQCGILLLVNGVMRMERVLAFTAVLFYSDESSSSLALAQRRPRSHWVAEWGLVGIVLPRQDMASLIQPHGWIVLLGFLALAWFLGAYLFLRWPWMSYRRLLQRWFLVITCVLLIAVTFGWLFKPESLSRFHRSTLLMLVAVMGIGGTLQRGIMHMLAQRQSIRPLQQPEALQALNQKPPNGQRELMLLLVAYHPSLSEVEALKACLSKLKPHVGYAVVVNDYQPGEPVDQLKGDADYFLANSDNPGYGRAVNRLVFRIRPLPPFIGVLNTDLTWCSGTFEKLLDWMNDHPDVSLSVPQILDETGGIQKLCKQNPTLLGLFSRRFVPDSLKPGCLKNYDSWYVMADQDYQQVFEAPYLSGCCMLIKSEAFCRAGGFDERFFLYLEDADLTRSLAMHGRCIHLPIANVTHGWGRGNYKSFKLTLVNFISAWSYFRKWGWLLF